MGRLAELNAFLSMDEREDTAFLEEMEVVEGEQNSSERISIHDRMRNARNEIQKNNIQKNSIQTSMKKVEMCVG